MDLQKVFVALLAAGMILTFSSRAFADEQAEIILRALINAGVITQGDIDKAAAQVKKEGVQKDAVTPQTIKDRVEVLEQKASRVPAWIENMRLKGDLRLRHEMKTVHPGEDDNKERLKFSIGVTTEVNDNVELGFGLATGSDDSPRSTNQTLESEFQSKNIWLDYAYAQYQPTGWLTLTGGQFASPFFHTDMLWDSDIRFDGFAAKATMDILQDTSLPTELSLIGGYFPIDNNVAGESDLYLTAIQGLKKVKFGDTAKFISGLIYYNFHGIEGYSTASLAEEVGTNTTIAGGIANDFQVLSPSMKLTFNDLFGFGFPFSVIGEYAKNLVIDNKDDNDAWRAGVEFGSSIKKKDDWHLLVQYSKIERDAFFDAFPDGDFNNAGTNAKGWEAIAGYGIADNVILGLDYYYTNVVMGAEIGEQVLQSDIIFKF